MNIHAVSLKGHRDDNEDKHIYFLNKNSKNKDLAEVNYMGIYDGHGGKFVSKFLHKYLHLYFIDKNIIYPISTKYIIEKFNEVNTKLLTKYEKQASDCGSTCLIALYYKNPTNNLNYITIANTGDSRSILCRNNIAVPLTKDHKPNWPEEKSRIEKLNGKIKYDGDDYRIKDLSVSRSFGDKSAHPFITCVPDVFNYEITNQDKFIILACDGLWDVLSNQEVVNFILIECYKDENRINKDTNIANKLATYAIKRGSQDNVSILVAFFN